MSSSRPARPRVPRAAAAVDGANARVLAPAPTPRPEAEPRRRTPLAVVPAGARRRRVPFAVFCFSALLAALATVLVLNIQVSTGQYELVQLRQQETALAQENEALTQRAQYLEAPQILASKAAELGMVVPGSVASIDLDTGKVSGTASPATKEDAPSALVAQPEAPGRQPEAPEDGRRQAQEPAAGRQQAAAEDPAAAAGRGDRDPGSGAGDGGAAAERPDFAESELNGGTIPAPQQRAAGE